MLLSQLALILATCHSFLTFMNHVVCTISVSPAMKKYKNKK